MRKFLSVLITVAMLMSLVSALRVPTAEAATYSLTKAKSWMGTANSASGQYISYYVVNYTMGENIVSTGDQPTTPGDYKNKFVLLVGGSDYPDAAWTVVQTSKCDSLGHFSLATSNVRYDGLYKVIIIDAPDSDNDGKIDISELPTGFGYSDSNTNNILDVGEALAAAPTTGGNILWGAYVFIKYVWQLDKPASITYNCASVTFSGYIRFGSGKGADTGTATVSVNYPDFTLANNSSVQIDGNWAMSIVINQKGLYLIWVSDTYFGNFSPTGEHLNAYNSVTYPTQDDLIGGLDNLAYDSKITGGAKIIIDTIVKPTLLYATSLQQEIVLTAFDDTGDPVIGVTWVTSGFTTVSSSEIAPGVYKFVLTKNGSIASFQATKAIGATLVKSNILTVPYTPLTKFNPMATVDVNNASAHWYFNNQNYTYDLLPLKIGYSFILKVAVMEVNNTDKYDIAAKRAQVKGPVYKIDGPEFGYNNLDTDINKYDTYGYGWARFLVTGTGEVTVTITQKTWERVDPSAEFDEYNACCLTDSMTFTIGKDECCDVKVENPTITKGVKGDIKIDISGEACGCDVIVRVSPAHPAEDFFTLTDGSVAGELWYNLTGATHNWNETCDTVTHHIYPWPYTPYYIDQAFQFTNGNATYVGGVVKWPNVTANYCDFLKVEVFTRETTTACSGSCSTYKFCSVLPYAIQISTDIVEITADKDTLVAGLPETITFKVPNLKSTTALWVYYSDLIPWYGSYYYYPAGSSLTPYAYINNGDGTATVNFMPPPNYGGYALTDDDWGGAALTVEFRTTDSATGCVTRQIMKLHVIPPSAEATMTVGCNDKIAFDGILTEGFSEKVTIESLKDPRNDKSIIDLVTDFDFDVTWDEYWGNCYIPGAWVISAPCEGCGILSKAVLGLRNPNSSDDPSVYPYIEINGVYVYLYSLKMLVTPPTITVEPNKDIPFITLGQPETMLKFTAIDAHGKAMCGKTFSIYDINTMTTAYTLVGMQEVGAGGLVCIHDPVAIPNDTMPGPFLFGGDGYDHQEEHYAMYFAAFTSVASYHTGNTGTDGSVFYPFRPPFGGRYAVMIVPDAGVTFGAPKLPLQAFLNTTKLFIETKYTPPVKDTESPAIAIDAPADGTEVSVPYVTVKGKATDNVAVVSLWIGATKVDFAPDGTFSLKVELEEGENTIKVVGFDAEGNKGEKSIKVVYKKPVEVKKTVVVLQIGSDIMTVNGKAVQLDAAPEIKDGRTFLPLRAIAEIFGATVEWIPDTKGVTVTLGDNTIGLQIGNPTAVINGEVMDIVAPYIKNGRTMVPLRVIAEGLGATVEWDPALRTITIIM